MKTKIFSISLLTAAVFGLSSCSDNWKEDELVCPQFGQLSKHIVDVVNGENIITTSRSGSNPADFVVTVKDSEGKQIGQWVYSQMPELVTLPVGNGYTVSVVSPENPKAAFESPYFEGFSEEFNIENNKITEIGTVTCKLANIKVSVKYSADLKKALGQDCKVTVEANDEGSLEFAPDETRAGYFQALEGSTSMVATLSGTIDGNYEEIRTILKDVEAGQHRIITYSFAGGDPTPPDENGYIDPSTGIQIGEEIIDETVEGGVNVDEDLIDGQRPGQEDPEQPEEPGEDDPNNPDNPDNPDDDTPAATFEAVDSPNLNLGGVNLANGYEGNAKVLIKCPKGIAHLVVDIKTDSSLFEQIIDEMNLATFDLAYPGDAKESLESLELPIEGDVIGQTEVVFDITQFVSLLVYPGNHDFVLTVTDNDKAVSSMTLRFKSE